MWGIFFIAVAIESIFYKPIIYSYRKATIGSSLEAFIAG